MPKFGFPEIHWIIFLGGVLSIKLPSMQRANLDISCFENSVDPDQLASEKPADQGPHCFPLFVTTSLKLNGYFLGGVVHKITQHAKS